MLVKIAGVPITTEFWVTDALHKKPHKGLDLALGEGSPLYAVGKGVVEVVNYGNQNIGHGVIVKMENGLRVVYGHLSAAKVKTGDLVEPGQMIAYSGNTGRSSGPHLHFQMQDSSGAYLNPTKYVESAIKKPSSPWVPDFLEKPAQQLGELNDKLDAFIYWINPVHWVKDGWRSLEQLFAGGTIDEPFIAASIILVILIGLGANWPKKWLFWGWVVYWLLRGFVFV